MEYLEKNSLKNLAKFVYFKVWHNETTEIIHKKHTIHIGSRDFGVKYIK